MTEAPMMSAALTVVLALLLGTAWGLLTPSILRRLPEPAAESGDETGDQPAQVIDEDLAHKIPYAALATGPFAATVGLLTAFGAAIPAGALRAGAPPSGAPPSGALLPCWLVLATLGVLLAAIDARTTWLPLPLTRVAWVAMAVAVGVAGLLGGWAVALRGVVGFTLAGAIFGAIWLVTRGGFGFGDVRYAPLVGAATASVSWTVLAWGLVLGSLVGALVGLGRLARGRRSAFAYAPSILAGGYLAITLAWLTT